jgi:aspartate carbamoyltransferase catalytic subunit
MRARDMGIPPWKGILIRLGDKMSRLESFARKESFQVKDESLIDTLRDVSVYAILAIILYREEKKK